MNDRIVSANSVVRRRLALRWTQAKLAERAGISRAAVSAIEGERLSPSVATALALAVVFECSVEELFGRPEFPAGANGEFGFVFPRRL
jgi:DNA-binding XRE family transcriptional regulator